MIFNSLRINNYRAYYGECNFDFPIDDERNISILYADNDVGKSCFFSAILFCLYGPKDNDDLKDLINVNAQSEKCYHAAVSLFVENGSDKIEISRTIDLRGKLDALVSDTPGGLFLGLLLYTSCRRGEALALQWRDVDLDKGQIHITKSVTYMGNAPLVGPTKTEAGERVNPILDPLRPWLERALRAHPKGGGYLFGGAEPLTSSQFNKLWLDLLEPAGLTTTTDGGAWKGNRKSQRRALVTPHQLRHEYAYTLYRAGVPALAAKALMGHSDIRVTQNIYTELGQRDLTDAAALLNAYVGQSRESPETNMDKSHTDNQKTGQ